MGTGLRGVREIGAHTLAQAFGFADVEQPFVFAVEEVHARCFGERFRLFFEAFALTAINTPLEGRSDVSRAEGVQRGGHRRRQIQVRFGASRFLTSGEELIIAPNKFGGYKSAKLTTVHLREHECATQSRVL